MGPRRLAAAVAVLSTTAVLPAAASARTLERLDVRRAVLDADRGHVVLDLRCRASRAACRGTLRATSFEEQPITAAKRVQLDRRRTRRLALRLRPDGLERLSMSTAPPDVLVGARLVTARNTLVGDGLIRARVSCRSGHTVAISPAIRVLRVDGFGVYVCERRARRVTLLAPDSVGLAYSFVVDVRLAGPYVGFTTVSGFKCPESGISLYDVRVHGVVRSADAITVDDSFANACTGTTRIPRFVLRASGALAWTEGRGPARVVPVRAMDDAGTRLLD